MKVLCAGHICLDITPVFPAGEVSRLSELLTPGKLIHVGQPAINLGGAVANTGLAMAFFGAEVRLAAKIGRDDFGQLVRNQLAAHPVELTLTEDESSGTSYSIVLAVPGFDRLFLHDPGANNTFIAADITADMLDGVGHMHFGYPPLMRRMYENAGQELAALFRFAKSRGITTSLDMAAVDPHNDSGRADWKGLLSAVLPMTDYFVPSVEELCYMLDRERYDQWNRRPGELTDGLEVDRDIKPLADELVRLGAHTILIKCGAPGLYYRSGSAEGFERSFKPDRVASATGAGDTCIAAFLTSILRGGDLRNSVRLAAAAGACCVTQYDALSGLLPLEELERKMAAGWEKN